MVAHRRWTDERVEQVIGHLLRVGVMLSTAVVLTGGILYLAKYGKQPTHYQQFYREPAQFRDVGDIIKYAFHGSSRAIIQFGLLLLILTPIARVAFSVVAFALERDWMYVGITLVVLGILLFSLVGS